MSYKNCHLLTSLASIVECPEKYNFLELSLQEFFNMNMDNKVLMKKHVSKPPNEIENYHVSHNFDIISNITGVKSIVINGNEFDIKFFNTNFQYLFPSLLHHSDIQLIWDGHSTSIDFDTFLYSKKVNYQQYINKKFFFYYPNGFTMYEGILENHAHILLFCDSNW